MIFMGTVQSLGVLTLFDQTSLSIVCLGSFLLAAGFLLAGFQSTRLALIATRAGQSAFVIGTMALSVLAFGLFQNVSGETSDHMTAEFFAAALAWVSIATWLRWRMQLIGAFTAPVISLTLLLDIFFGSELPAVASVEIPGPLISIHIGSAIIGQVFAVAACGASLMLLWQQRKLKSRQLNSLPMKFPALDTLGQALGVFLWLGFSFITLSLLSGAIYTVVGHLVLGISLKLKVIWALMVWVWYLSILVLRHVLHYRPQKIARMSLMGFVLMALSWFGFAFAHAGGGL